MVRRPPRGVVSVQGGHPERSCGQAVAHVRRFEDLDLGSQGEQLVLRDLGRLDGDVDDDPAVEVGC